MMETSGEQGQENTDSPRDRQAGPVPQRECDRRRHDREGIQNQAQRRFLRVRVFPDFLLGVHAVPPPDASTSEMHYTSRRDAT